MYISVFDLFKIGVGPSSSHTMGPMKAGALFSQAFIENASQEERAKANRAVVHLYGSLSATGRGHGTDRACVAGLMGFMPDTVNPDVLSTLLEDTAECQGLKLNKEIDIDFCPTRDIVFHDESLPFHPNAVRFEIFHQQTMLASATYYSVGGGFVVEESKELAEPLIDESQVPYPFNSAAELLRLCKEHDLRISELVRANELALRSQEELDSGLDAIWDAMNGCINRGLQQKGRLPGGLNVARRAEALHHSLNTSPDNLISTTFTAMDWVNLYALAVNEENAAGGRVVTAPTNGAAGIVPAVLRYFVSFSNELEQEDIRDYLLAASAVGMLCKLNASISGAEVGCQGEVGSACAMAAAGLADVLGGTAGQVENAAEVGLEHNLGLTCDPIGGLVQIPCIERNAIAATKAINAAQMALRGDGSHYVSLDDVIKTMRDTGRDMMDKYKETSQGGLAVNVIEC